MSYVPPFQFLLWNFWATPWQDWILRLAQSRWETLQLTFSCFGQVSNTPAINSSQKRHLCSLYPKPVSLDCKIFLTCSSPSNYLCCFLWVVLLFPLGESIGELLLAALTHLLSLTHVPSISWIPILHGHQAPRLHCYKDTSSPCYKDTSSPKKLTVYEV